jgi:hypothetical protein
MARNCTDQRYATITGHRGLPRMTHWPPDAMTRRRFARRVLMQLKCIQMHLLQIDAFAIKGVRL